MAACCVHFVGMLSAEWLLLPLKQLLGSPDV